MFTWAGETCYTSSDTSLFRRGRHQQRVQTSDTHIRGSAAGAFQPDASGWAPFCPGHSGSPGDTRRWPIIPQFIYIMGPDRERNLLFWLFLTMLGWFRKNKQKKQPEVKMETIFQSPSRISFTRSCCTFLLHLIHRSLPVTRVPAFIGSNFLLTERSSRCEKRELNREKCPQGA